MQRTPGPRLRHRRRTTWPTVDRGAFASCHSLAGANGGKSMSRSATSRFRRSCRRAISHAAAAATPATIHSRSPLASSATFTAADFTPLRNWRIPRLNPAISTVGRMESSIGTGPGLAGTVSTLASVSTTAPPPPGFGGVIGGVRIIEFAGASGCRTGQDRRGEPRRNKGRRDRRCVQERRLLRRGS